MAYKPVTLTSNRKRRWTHMHASVKKKLAAFEEEFQKQQEHQMLHVVIFELAMEEINIFKNEIFDPKQSIEHTGIVLEEEVEHFERNMLDLEEHVKEIYEYQKDTN